MEQVTAAGDYVAISAGDKVRLYQYRDERWIVTETRSAPPPPFRITIPAPGALATISDGLLRYNGETRNTKGAVRSIVSHQGTPLAAGDFADIWTVTSAQQAEEDYEVAKAAPGAVLAIGSGRLAVSNAEGTALLELSTEERLTATGRVAAVLAFLSGMASLLIAILPMLLKQLLKLFARLLGGKDGGASGSLPPLFLVKPPAPLVERIGAGRSVLWAGAGLSAQAGLTLRTPFVVSLINAGTVESWLKGPDAEMLQAMVEAGDTEGAMETLTTMAPKRVSPETIRSMVPKYATTARTHDVVAALPFAAGVTTNYDDLLERTRAKWNTLVLTPGSGDTAVAGGLPFLMKLYGDVAAPATVRMSRGQLAADFPGLARRLLNNVGSLNTILFVGASLENLLADLDALGLADLRGGTHYAVTGSANPHWKKTADELKGRYSIETIACVEENIGTELPKFLDELARSVEEMLKPQEESELTSA